MTDDAETPIAPVIDLAARREAKESKSDDTAGWSFEYDADGDRLVIRYPSGEVARFSPGSARRIGEMLVNASHFYRQKAYREELEREHVPALRHAMNDALLAYRSGTCDEAAEERAQKIRHAHYMAWNSLTERERGRWLRLMRQRRDESK
jgi:hypothetical protein